MKKLFLILTIICSATIVWGQNWKYIDYRQYQTPVQNQGNRGTCSAFGIAAALEMLPGVPADVSEQYIYGALKHSQKDKPFVTEGDRLENYIPSLQKYGFVHEEVLPYNPKKIPWESYDDNFERIIVATQLNTQMMNNLQYFAKYSISNSLQYQYFDAKQSTDPELIKNLLRNGYKAVAVLYSDLHLKTWSEGNCSAENPFDPSQILVVEILGTKMYYQQAKKIYGEKLMDDIITGKVKAYYYEEKNEDNYGGHMVTIVGYNEKGFIFKNSWGEDWGEKGYGYISYDAHKWMIQETLVFKSATFNKPVLKQNVGKNSEFMLKVTLSNNQTKDYQLSIYNTDLLHDPMITRVTYKVYDQKRNLLDKEEKLSPIIGPYDNSFTATIFEGERELPPLDAVMQNSPLKIIVDIYPTGLSEKKQTITFKNVYLRPDEFTGVKNSISTLLQLGK